MKERKKILCVHIWDEGVEVRMPNVSVLGLRVRYIVNEGVERHRYQESASRSVGVPERFEGRKVREDGKIIANILTMEAKSRNASASFGRSKLTLLVIMREKTQGGESQTEFGPVGCNPRLRKSRVREPKNRGGPALESTFPIFLSGLRSGLWALGQGLSETTRVK